MTIQHFDRAQPGWEMIQPGVYMDTQHQMHFFAGEFLVANGYADTPENRRTVEGAIEEQIRQKYGRIPIHHTAPPDERA